MSTCGRPAVFSKETAEIPRKCKADRPANGLPHMTRPGGRGPSSPAHGPRHHLRSSYLYTKFTLYSAQLERPCVRVHHWNSYSLQTEIGSNGVSHTHRLFWFHFNVVIKMRNQEMHTKYFQ